MSPDSASALRDALSAEHVAIWTYGLASAFVTEPRVSSAVTDALGNHKQQRDSTEQLLEQAGVPVPQTQPAYTLPQPVTDQGSAIQVLIVAENDCQIGWRSVLERTDAGDAAARHIALNGLTASAARATRWRITVGQNPAATPFPGKP